MSSLLAGLVSVLVATNQPAALSNLVVQTAGVSIDLPDANDPVEREYHKLMEDDDKALAEVDEWIRNNEAFAAKGGGTPPDVLNARIRARFAPVKQAYEDFLLRHPKHV